MLPDLGPLAWGWLALVLLVASVVRGYSGFGFSALVVAGGALAVDPARLVPAVILLEIALTAPQWPSMRGEVDWRRAGLLFLGCLAGVPLGVRAAAALGPDATRALVSLWVLAMCAVLLRGWRLARRPGDVAHGAVGLVSGLANGVGIGGLPVAAFFAAQGLPPAAFRATLVAYFALLDLWTLPVMAWSGLVGRDTLLLAALALPVTLLGLHLGSRRFLLAPPEEFRRLAILLLAGLAVLGLARAAL